METVVLHGASKADLKLLTDLAEKIGVKVRYLDPEEAEDLAMLNAINEGRTEEYVDTEAFLKKLKK